MKTLIKIVIVLIIIVVLIISGRIFALNTSREVDVVWDDSDFQSGMNKSGIEIGHIEEINLETLVRGNFVNPM